MSALPTKSRLLPKVVAALVVLALVAVGFVYWLRPTARVAAVRRGHAVDARPGSVQVVPEYELDLKTEVGGRVTKSVLAVGARFKEGDFMTQLDTGDLDVSIEKAENDLATLKRRIAVGSQIQLQLDTAQADLKNAERMHELQQESDSDLEKQRRVVKAIEQQLALEKVANDSQVRSGEIGVQDLKRQRDKMTIRAPFDGVVSEVDAQRGALITGGASVGHFIMTGRIVEARISEENFAGITVGKKANVRFLGYDSSKLFEAEVVTVLPTAETTTQRYVVYLKVNIPIESLTPGLTGEVSIIVDTDPWALLIPRRALFGRKVFVITNGRVELRTVTPGYIGLNEVGIKDGIKEGEQVIVDDLDQYSPGDRVRTEVAPN